MNNEFNQECVYGDQPVLKMGRSLWLLLVTL